MLVLSWKIQKRRGCLLQFVGFDLEFEINKKKELYTLTYDDDDNNNNTFFLSLYSTFATNRIYN
jgi:hypothetical protein